MPPSSFARSRTSPLGAFARATEPSLFTKDMGDSLLGVNAKIDHFLFTFKGRAVTYLVTGQSPMKDKITLPSSPCNKASPAISSGMMRPVLSRAAP